MVAAVLGTGLLAAACGGRSSGNGVASLSSTTTTTTVSSVAPPKNATEAEGDALAYVDCLRSHGEPDMPDPTVSGRHVSINIGASSGVNPSSPQFVAAAHACKHLLPNGGVPKGPSNVFTAADQADYLKAAACMRAHGIANFPDPTFANDSLAFDTRTPIDTNTAQYRRALATCEELIPAGLPYSSSGGS